MAMMRLLFLTMRDVARSRARLQVELLAVRHALESYPPEAQDKDCAPVAAD